MPHERARIDFAFNRPVAGETPGCFRGGGEWRCRAKARKYFVAGLGFSPLQSVAALTRLPPQFGLFFGQIAQLPEVGGAGTSVGEYKSTEACSKQVGAVIPRPGPRQGQLPGVWYSPRDMVPPNATASDRPQGI